MTANERVVRTLGFDLGGGWEVSAEFVEQDGRPVIAGLRVSPSADGVPPGGLTIRRLRSIGLNDLLADARAWATPEQPHPKTAQTVAKYLSFLKSDPKPGRRGRPPAFWAAVALQYDWLVKGGSRRPVADLAAKRGVSQATARDLVYEARDKGYLTRTGRGVAGGIATEAAYAALQDEAERQTKRKGKR